VVRVFVSYASQDYVLAGEVCGWVVEAGHEVFLDQDPYAGRQSPRIVETSFVVMLHVWLILWSPRAG
jgi:hypothetical protein